MSNYSDNRTVGKTIAFAVTQGGYSCILFVDQLYLNTLAFSAKADFQKGCILTNYYLYIALILHT